ncbi:MAG: hypothetical protein ABI488_04375 [Polyangiaceae bacterium]
MRKIRFHTGLLGALGLVFVACGGSDAGAGNGSKGAGGAGGAGGTAASANGGARASGDAGADAAGTGASGDGTAGMSPGNGASGSGTGSGIGPRGFRRGVNPGYYGSGIDRRESAQMSVAAGASSLRTPLPEYYLKQWGDAIEVSDYAYYQSIGLDRIVVFLEGPSAEHSNAPAGASTDELSHYSPKNLYQPIFLADGTVNPDNYWASYVARVVQNYGAYVDTFEVWNEPDQVGSNWQATTTWDKSAPQPSDLIWWNDTIFSYIRMLRVTWEVVHQSHPSCRVTAGGIGYDTFLAALLRFTDEPKAGAVSADYPDTGAKYLDLIDYHYYPVFSGGSSDHGVDGFLQARDGYQARLINAKAANRQFLVTESGAPRYALGTYPGGTDYSASYLLKCMTLAHYEGFVGVDWFAQGDGAKPGASMDSFQYMGLYLNYSDAMTVSDAKLSVQGQAYAWLGSWLPGSAADSAALSALALPTSVRGAAFQASTGSHLYVLWAVTSMDESATASFALPASADVTVHTFSVTAGAKTQTQHANSGSVMLALTGMPTVVEVPAGS